MENECSNTESMDTVTNHRICCLFYAIDVVHSTRECIMSSTPEIIITSHTSIIEYLIVVFA